MSRLYIEKKLPKTGWIEKSKKFGLVDYIPKFRSRNSANQNSGNWNSIGGIPTSEFRKPNFRNTPKMDFFKENLEVPFRRGVFEFSACEGRREQVSILFFNKK